MIRFYPLQIKRDWPMLTKHLPVLLCEDTQGIIAINGRGACVGACVMDSWSNTSVQVHIWIGNPMAIRHGFLHEIAEHVYVTCKRDVMIGIVPGDNAKALKFDKHIGFEEVARIKDGFNRGVDYVILEMRRENCRWLKENHGREIESTQSA